MYRVIRYFTDLQDNDYPYYIGNIFPREGLTVSKKRLEELAGSNNKQRRPLIELVKEKKSYTKTEINRMSKAELQELAIDSGVEGVKEMTGAELKEYLLAVFGL